MPGEESGGAVVLLPLSLEITEAFALLAAANLILVDFQAHRGPEPQRVEWLRSAVVKLNAGLDEAERRATERSEESDDGD